MSNINISGIDLTTGQEKVLAVGDTPTDSAGNPVGGFDPDAATALTFTNAPGPGGSGQAFLVAADGAVN